MAVKAATARFEAGGLTVKRLLDRLQSVGPGAPNLNPQLAYEVGNRLATDRTIDTPDLTFDVESWDMTTELECIITGANPDTPSALGIDFGDAKPFNIISPWTASLTGTTSVGGIAVPYLTLENVTYRFGVRATATQTFSFRGDSVYIADKTPYLKHFNAAAVLGAGVGPYLFDNTAIETVELGANVFALCVTLYHTDGTYSRLFHGADFTDNSAGFTLEEVPASGDILDVVYFSATARTDLLQADHPAASVKPGSLRAKDIDVYVSNKAATPELERFANVQQVEVSRRVNLDRDEELGNAHVVALDYDVPDVTGSLTLRPATLSYYVAKLAQLQGRTTDEVLNPLHQDPTEMEIRMYHPETHAILKTLYVEDAIFNFGANQPRVQQKLEPQLPFQSLTGQMLVFDGART